MMPAPNRLKNLLVPEQGPEFRRHPPLQSANRGSLQTPWFPMAQTTTDMPAHQISSTEIVRLLCGVLSIAIAASSASAEDSEPGLTATWHDGSNTVRELVPTPHFYLRAAESVHPHIHPEFSAQFTGLLKIARAGKYRFDSNAKVEVNGSPAHEFLQLATGEHPISIRYQREAGDARLVLNWESEYFRPEPVPSSVLVHTASTAAAQVQDSTAQGRYLFAELGCGNCHAAANWKLQSRRGPDLTEASTRLKSGWINEWLQSPREYRPASVMPVCVKNVQERADVTAFLLSLSPAGEQELPESPRDDQLENGKELFEQTGCTKCHDKQNNLDAVGSKFVSPRHLASFIANPHRTDPAGRMPQLFDPTEEVHLAANVAAYLFHANQRDEPYAEPPAGDAARGALLFSSRGCASCHEIPSSRIKTETIPVAPAFGQPTGLPLRNVWDFDGDGQETVTDQVTGRTEKVTGRTKFSESDMGHGRAFDFDGNTFIELSHFHRPDTMTISVRVKTTHGGSIITWGRPGGGQRGSRELRMNIGQDGMNSVCYGEYNSDGGWKPVVVRPDDINLIDGEWHHIAVVRDGMKIQHYIDGRAYGRTGIAQPGQGDYTDTLLIGALGLQSNPSNRFRGLMDDLSVWNTALSADQIAALAAGESALAMARPEAVEVKPYRVNAGCLAESVPQPLPDYRLTDSDRAALQTFLSSEQAKHSDAHHDAPLMHMGLLIRQFRCTACHEYHDQNIQAAVRVTESGRIKRVERPPLLTGAGAKLTIRHLQNVLINRHRNRPWLNLRMPHFGDGVRDLPGLLAASAGYGPEDSDPKPDRKLADAGLVMIGEQRGQAACIACHNYRGINRRKDGVVPAPDLAEAGQTVRAEWFERWMHAPQRLRPGTSMPVMFTEFSVEERSRKISQLWSAIVYQKDLPLPKGVLDQQTEGTRIIVKDEPVIFRMATKTPAGQIDRAINVGVPGGLNFTFDAVSCRLVYAWKGAFLDAGPAWNGRGGNPVSAGGDSLAVLRDEHVVRIGGSEAKTLRFLGYRLVDGIPVFRYQVDKSAIEHRIDMTPAAILQTIRVEGASDDVFYVSDGSTAVRSASGKDEGDSLRFPQADVVEFQIEIPIDGG